MSLDLDAIRTHIGRVDKVLRDTLDCTEKHDEPDHHEAGLINALSVTETVMGDLLAEVERLRAANELLNSPFCGPDWMAEGRWEAEYWREAAGIAMPAGRHPIPEANRKRSVWRGPEEPFDYEQHQRAENEWDRDEAAAAQRAAGDDS